MENNYIQTTLSETHLDDNINGLTIFILDFI